MKKDIRAYTYEELQEELKTQGEKAFRAKQIYEWLHVKLVDHFDEMTNLSKALREKLEENYEILPVVMLERQISQIDGTNKFLFRLYDGNVVESVLMKYKHGNSVCISSQVGCRMGCRFCATGRQGLRRSLSTGEILNQILAIPESARLTNIVFMGMGEPLLNLKNVMRALESLNNDKGLNFSPRRITVSTCGIEKGLRELGESGLAYLAVSLHAPTQELRARIMPKAARWPLEDLLQALKSYPLKTRERITFEYLLLGGVNDGLEQARQLARVVSDVKGKLNLIVYNPSEGDPYKAPSPERVLAFEQYLWDRNITAIIRKSKGQDIKAACGQLKAARQNEAGEQA